MINKILFFVLLSITFSLGCKEKKGPMENKGIGPVKSVTLDNEIDLDMVEAGKKTFEFKCASCHKMSEKYIGPAMEGITKRRSPEWIMNMMLNPEEMLEKDSIARGLLETYPTKMVELELSQEESRTILEYFRNSDQGGNEQSKKEANNKGG